jgi:hypothetical protein
MYNKNLCGPNLAVWLRYALFASIDLKCFFVLISEKSKVGVCWHSKFDSSLKAGHLSKM